MEEEQIGVVSGAVLARDEHRTTYPFKDC